MLTAISLLLFTLLCIALSGDAAWDNVTKPERNALVFEGRHRAYGAFVLRREYDQRFVLAFLMAVTVIAVAIGVPRLVAMMAPDISISIPHTHTTTVILEPPITTAPDPAPPKPTPAVIPPVTRIDHSDVIVVDSLVHTTTPIDTGSTVITPILPKGGGIGDTGLHTTGLNTRLLPAGPIDAVMADSVPVYPGGERAMLAFVRNNVRFTDGAMGDAGSDHVFVQFVVDADGSVISVRSVKGKFEDLKSEAARVVRLMPKWKPALYKGEHVPCRLMLPINFELRE